MQGLPYRVYDPQDNIWRFVCILSNPSSYGHQNKVLMHNHGMMYTNKPGKTAQSRAEKGDFDAWGLRDLRPMPKKVATIDMGLSSTGSIVLPTRSQKKRAIDLDEEPVAKKPRFSDQDARLKALREDTRQRLQQSKADTELRRLLTTHKRYVELRPQLVDAKSSVDSFHEGLKSIISEKQSKALRAVSEVLNQALKLTVAG